MQARRIAPYQRRRHDLELLLLRRGHRFIHGGETVEKILGPGRDGQRRALRVAGSVLRLGEIEQVGDEPLLVHPVGGDHVIARRR